MYVMLAIRFAICLSEVNISSKSLVDKEKRKALMGILRGYTSYDNVYFISMIQKLRLIDREIVRQELKGLANELRDGHPLLRVLGLHVHKISPGKTEKFENVK